MVLIIRSAIGSREDEIPIATEYCCCTVRLSVTRQLTTVCGLRVYCTPASACRVVLAIRCRRLRAFAALVESLASATQAEFLRGSNCRSGFSQRSKYQVGEAAVCSTARRWIILRFRRNQKARNPFKML